MSRSFHRLSNLRRLGDRPELQSIVNACAKAFNRLTGHKRALDETSTSGIVIPDIDGLSERLSNDSSLLEAFKRAGIDVPHDLEIQRFKRFTLHGKSVSTNSFHSGNSHVTYRDPSLLIPLQIEHLVFARSMCPTQKSQDRHHGAWAVVKQYRPLDGYDPFSRFKLFRAQLFDRALEDRLEVVPLVDIEAHHLACYVDWRGQEVTAVQSLSRVCKILASICFTAHSILDACCDCASFRSTCR